MRQPRPGPGFPPVASDIWRSIPWMASITPFEPSARHSSSSVCLNGGTQLPVEPQLAVAGIHAGAEP